MKQADEVTEARVRKMLKALAEGKTKITIRQTRLDKLEPRKVARFMRRIFNIREFLISDEADIASIVSYEATRTTVVDRIKSLYGQEVTIHTPLVEIMEKIVK